MKFVGQVWKEGMETRGKVSFIDEKGLQDNAFYFNNFEDLKKILEKEYKKSS